MLFAVPFVLDITDYLVEGTNTLEIEVANLPANRIAQLDRDGVEWRKFKEINVVDLNYKKTHYDQWEVVPSGLNGSVRLIPCRMEWPMNNNVRDIFPVTEKSSKAMLVIPSERVLHRLQRFYDGLVVVLIAVL